MKNSQFLTIILVLILSAYTMQANAPLGTDKELNSSAVKLIQDEEDQEATPLLEDLSLLPVKETLVHANFVLEFPSLWESTERDGLVITTCQGNGYTLSALQCPVGLEQTGIHMIASELDALLDIKTSRDVEIDNLPLKAYQARKMFTESDSCSNYGVLYALNTLEKTYLFLQISHSEADWWTHHISWNLDGRTQRSSSELLTLFNDFLHRQMLSIAHSQINITEEDQAIRITLIEDVKALQKDKAAMTVFNLIKNFSVFNDFAQNKYAFVVEHIDSEGTPKAEFTFPHSLYSKWSNYDQFLKSLDDNLPEGTHEAPHRAIGG